METIVKEALNVNIVDPNINIIEREIKKELRQAGKRFLRKTLKKNGTENIIIGENKDVRMWRPKREWRTRLQKY